ncbi:hypothetical protein [Klebsiella pneumoniae]|nr:hypothetical protein [Klebsiella pneumoniae]MED6004896.1 hypothetical protein [Klebsiella pneumoniae]MED6058290.1 hypothetical protein [Klebsiella pneumoniae]
MEFKSEYVICKNKQQVNVVKKSLEENGYKKWKAITELDGDFIVSIYADKTYSVVEIITNGSGYITYEEFLSKYGVKESEESQVESDLYIKINEAKEKLKLSNNQLSYALGKSKPYITKMLNYPQTEKVSKRVISEIDKLLEGSNVESFIKKLNAKNKLIGELQHSVRMLNGEVEQLKYEHGKKVTELRKTIENKIHVINNLDDKLIFAKKVHNEDLAQINELSKKYKEADEIILDLENSTVELVKKKIELSQQLEKERFSVGRLGGELDDANRCRDYWMKQSDYLEEELIDANEVIKRDRIVAIVVFVIILLVFGVFYGRVL